MMWSPLLSVWCSSFIDSIDSMVGKKKNRPLQLRTLLFNSGEQTKKREMGRA